MLCSVFKLFRVVMVLAMKRTFSDTLMEYDDILSARQQPQHSGARNSSVMVQEPTDYWRQMAVQIEMHHKKLYYPPASLMHEGVDSVQGG